MFRIGILGHLLLNDILGRNVHCQESDVNERITSSFYTWNGIMDLWLINRRCIAVNNSISYFYFWGVE